MQRKAPIRVIIGNPPYSVGQTSANDNAQNQKYAKVESRIAETYAARTRAMKTSLYDSYIKAFGWASDRLDSKYGGIIAFVSNGYWIDSNAMDGFRKCLESEFGTIYVFNLRGNQRTSGDLSRREGGKIFGAGSRTPIAITFLVKQPNLKGSKAVIYYNDIGDYLNREEKLNIIKAYGSIANPKMSWKILTPNIHGDWLNQRDDVFSTLIALGNKDDKTEKTVFVPSYSNGLNTSRDVWCYNSCSSVMEANVKRLINFYNEQQESFHKAANRNIEISIEDYISYDASNIKWDQSLIADAKQGIKHSFDNNCIRYCLYRPFFKQHTYFNKSLNWSRYLLPKLFPSDKEDNLIITIPKAGSRGAFSVLMSNTLVDQHFAPDGIQCFPLFYYEQYV